MPTIRDTNHKFYNYNDVLIGVSLDDQNSIVDRDSFYLHLVSIYSFLFKVRLHGKINLV